MKKLPGFKIDFESFKIDFESTDKVLPLHEYLCSEKFLDNETTDL